MLTAVGIYKKGTDYYIKYRDDETQNNDSLGDKKIKHAKIYLKDGHYRFGSDRQLVDIAVSEAPDSDADGVPDALDWMPWFSWPYGCYYDSDLGGELVYDECGVCGGNGTSCGCTYPLACNYDITATRDDGSCIFAEDCATCDGSGGLDANDLDQDGVCDEDEVPGCTDPGYLNFNPLATDEDGSCSTPIAEGCTCECASNYDASANVDDGSCDTTTGSGCATVECPDLDCDGIVSVSDILALLAGFGMDCNDN
jgi:hypothetical protein